MGRRRRRIRLVGGLDGSRCIIREIENLIHQKGTDKSDARATTSVCGKGKSSHSVWCGFMYGM